MANMRAIRNRIKSIESTRQITRSMRMVAAAKLRRTQERWQKIGRFSRVSREVLQKLCGSMEQLEDPLLLPREGKRTALVLFVGSRGLCGTYNSAVVKAAEERIAASDEEISLVVCGRWGREQIAALGRPVLRVFDALSDDPTAEEARELTEYLKGLWLGGETDHIELLYEHYRSALTQEPDFLRLLPMDPGESAAKLDVIFEPDAPTLLTHLTELVLLNTLHAVLLEAKTSEHTARMTAMSAASDNTDELIAELSLKLNHARQAAITTEITEIVGGSNALQQRN